MNSVFKGSGENKKSYNVNNYINENTSEKSFSTNYSDKSKSSFYKRSNKNNSYENKNSEDANKPNFKPRNFQDSFKTSTPGQNRVNSTNSDNGSEKSQFNHLNSINSYNHENNSNRSQYRSKNSTRANHQFQNMDHKAIELRSKLSNDNTSNSGWQRKNYYDKNYVKNSSNYFQDRNSDFNGKYQKEKYYHTDESKKFNSYSPKSFSDKESIKSDISISSYQNKHFNKYIDSYNKNKSNGRPNYYNPSTNSYKNNSLRDHGSEHSYSNVSDNSFKSKKVYSIKDENNKIHYNRDSYKFNSEYNSHKKYSGNGHDTRNDNTKEVNELINSDSLTEKTDSNDVGKNESANLSKFEESIKAIKTEALKEIAYLESIILNKNDYCNNMKYQIKQQLAEFEETVKAQDVLIKDVTNRINLHEASINNLSGNIPNNYHNGHSNDINGHSNDHSNYTNGHSSLQFNNLNGNNAKNNSNNNVLNDTSVEVTDKSLRSMSKHSTRENSSFSGNRSNSLSVNKNNIPYAPSNDLKRNEVNMETIGDSVKKLNEAMNEFSDTCNAIANIHLNLHQVLIYNGDKYIELDQIVNTLFDRIQINKLWTSVQSNSVVNDDNSNSNTINGNNNKKSSTHVKRVNIRRTYSLNDLKIIRDNLYKQGEINTITSAFSPIKHVINKPSNVIDKYENNNSRITNEYNSNGNFKFTHPSQSSNVKEVCNHIDLPKPLTIGRSFPRKSNDFSDNGSVKSNVFTRKHENNSKTSHQPFEDNETSSMKSSQFHDVADYGSVKSVASNNFGNNHNQSYKPNNNSDVGSMQSFTSLLTDGSNNHTNKSNGNSNKRGSPYPYKNYQSISVNRNKYNNNFGNKNNGKEFSNYSNQSNNFMDNSVKKHQSKSNDYVPYDKIPYRADFNRSNGQKTYYEKS